MKTKNMQKKNGKRTVRMRESTVKILLQSKLERAKYRIQLLRAAATEAREKNNTIRDFKIL